MKNKNEGVNFQHIGNMDEISTSFDVASRFTVETKGSNYVSTFGSKKWNFIIVLCGTVNIGKYQYLVIFKRKTIHKGLFKRISCYSK